jgi:hypothetical protein
MSTTIPSTKPLASKWGSRILLLIAALSLGSLYFGSFFGSETVKVDRRGVAFADSSHYYQLLKDHHYLVCLQQETPHNVEHRRKTLHHFDYLLVGDAVVRTARLAGASDIAAIWLVTPLLGALNFVLAFLLFRRAVGPALAWPGALMFALLPATWIYAAIPETWPLSGTAVLGILLMRDMPIPRWRLALLVAVFALNNFLLLLLIALLGDERETLRNRIAQLVRLGGLAIVTWLGMLALLGFTVSPDFLPYQFVDHTLRFKARMAENLSVFHPMRWAYNAVNGWIAPFVLNQHDLNFGRTAVLDSARAFPLGTLAVACFAVLAGHVLRFQFRECLAAVRKTGSWIAQVSGIGLYLALVFIATGLSLYYESFLYAGLFLPILILLLLRSLAGVRAGAAIMWIATAILALNAAQQIATYRGLLGV